MKYSELIDEGIKRRGYSLKEISELMQEQGVKIDRSYLSKLRNGKKSPASEKINEALAKVLEIDVVELKAAAYLIRMPKDVLEFVENKII